MSHKLPSRSLRLPTNKSISRFEELQLTELRSAVSGSKKGVLEEEAFFSGGRCTESLQPICIQEAAGGAE